MASSYPYAKPDHVYTDWLLIRRLARELNERFQGARVRDVGELEDGRFGLVLWRKRGESTIAIDVFAPTPVITVEKRELPVAAEPGFVRAAGAALRGTSLAGVKSRTGDRLIRFDFAARSRFGIEDAYALVCELVPRFGNVVLVKSGTIVAAAKEFAPTENAVRSIQAGHPYEPPPLRAGNATPLLSPTQAAALAQSPLDGELHVYRRDGALVQAHLCALPRYADLEHSRASSLLDILAEARLRDEQGRSLARAGNRRRELERRIARMEEKLRSELARAQARLQETMERDRLREQGENIYASLHELNAEQREEAKERAAALFAKYRKSASALEHLQRRSSELAQALRDAEQMRWDLERASDAELDDVAQAMAFAWKIPASAAPPSRRKRAPLHYQTTNGSRIYVGRTPIENADLTFRLARPGDLWFHVRNQPGAHVILQRDERTPAPESDILAAASLAALHSKAKSSPKVTVDYTLRKYVRKRPSAAPGLVFYTHPKSVYVEPREP